jgi:hypothetical protein
VNLVHLAGSERGRTRKWNANDDREAEAISINKSLLVLNQVIFKLSEGKRHAPLRESTLTRLLENSLGSNATEMVHRRARAASRQTRRVAPNADKVRVPQRTGSPRFIFPEFLKRDVITYS